MTNRSKFRVGNKARLLFYCWRLAALVTLLAP